MTSETPVRRLLSTASLMRSVTRSTPIPGGNSVTTIPFSRGVTFSMLTVALVRKVPRPVR